MKINISKHVTEVVQTLYKAKTHESPHHAVVYGTDGLHNELLPFTVVLNVLQGSYQQQMYGFGQILSGMGIEARAVVLVINGMLPDYRLRPMSIVLGMSRGGDYHQVVIDHVNERTIPSDNITDEDKAICAALFLGQRQDQSEKASAPWN